MSIPSRSFLLFLAVYLSALYPVSAQSPDPLYPIYDNGLWGLIDESGRVVLEPRFDQIGRGGGRWIPETWDQVDPPGQVLIDMTFAAGTPVRGRLIPARLDGELALVTRNGEILAHGIYDDMRAGFSDGLLEVEIGDRVGFVDESGELVIPIRWERAYPFNDGRAFVMEGDRWGIIDKTGSVVVPPTWDQVGYPTTEWVKVRIGDDWGVVDWQGNVIVPVRYDEIPATPMRPLLPVHDEGRIIYVKPDGEGTVAFEFQCPRARDTGRALALGFFNHRVAVVRCGDKYGIIDETGDFIVQPEWENISNFENGLALVRHRDKQGLLNEAGEFIIELQDSIEIWGLGNDEIGFSRRGENGYFNPSTRTYRTIDIDADRFKYFFNEGLSIAREGNKDGYIDETGAWVIPPRFHRAEPFRGPLAVVKQPISTNLHEIGYINRSGEVVWSVTLGGFSWLESTVDTDGLRQRE